MDIAIVPILGTHRIGVVGSSEIAPVADETLVFSGEDLITHGVEIALGRMLHGVGIPSRQIALSVGPGNGFGHGNLVGGGHEVTGFGNGDKFIVIFSQPG